MSGCVHITGKIEVFVFKHYTNKKTLKILSINANFFYAFHKPIKYFPLSLSKPNTKIYLHSGRGYHPL